MSDTGSRSAVDPFGPLPSLPKGDVAPPSGADVLAKLGQARGIEDFEFVRHALACVGQATYRWTLASDRLEWSTNAGQVIGVDASDLVRSGRGYASLLDPDNFTSRFEAVMRTPSIDEGEGVPFQIEYLFRPKGRGDASAIWLEDSGRWFAGPDGRPLEVFGVVRRIDERHARDQHLHFLGNCDPLTGMMNRGRMAEALGEAMSVAKRDNVPCAFLVAAISNLPVVNDAYGFDIADDVIVAIGRRLRQVVRTGDAIGRYSGAKFGMILSNCDDREIESAAERFLSVARESVIDTERGPVWAMLSIGGLVLPRYADTPNLAMARAEEALAEARRMPTDGFVAFRPSAERSSARGLNARAASEIVNGLESDRFGLAFQPIVDARTNAVVMHEALLRLSSQDGETVAAHHLVPIAEKLGLIRLLDRRMMMLAVQQLLQHPEARLSLNVSGITATDPRWFGQLTEILAEHGEAVKRLTVEIAETATLRDPGQTSRFIGGLRDLGCGIAIDGFGTGHTSFRNLKLLNVDMIKLDASFSELLSANRDNQYFLRSLVDLARRFDVRTIAERVQTEEDAELLRSWGVDYLQGKMFGDAVHELPWPQGEKTVTTFVAATGHEAEAGAVTSTTSPGDPDVQPRPEPMWTEEAAEPEAQAVPQDEAEPEVADQPEEEGLDFSRLRQALAALEAGRR